MADSDWPLNIREILSHTEPLPAEADTPIRHFNHTTAEILGTLNFLSRKAAAGRPAQRVVADHLGRVRQMALVSLIENLERFFKDLAAVCVDVLAPVTADDRFDKLTVTGTALVGHYDARTLGRAMCETQVMTDCGEINKRFKALIAPLHPAPGRKGVTDFVLLEARTADEDARYATLQLVWQLRHTVVHNVGVVTRSDAVKLRVLAKCAVEAPRLLVPTEDDPRNLVRFLEQVADFCNNRVCGQLAGVLTQIHAGDPTLIDPAERARYLADTFRVPVTVAGVAAAPPP